VLAIYAVALHVILLGLVPIATNGEIVNPFSVICHSTGPAAAGDETPGKPDRTRRSHRDRSLAARNVIQHCQCPTLYVSINICLWNKATAPTIAQNVRLLAARRTYRTTSFVKTRPSRNRPLRTLPSAGS